MFPYTLKRSKRKTLAAHVMPDGTIEVRAPLNLSRDIIDKFVSEKEPLLRRYISEQLTLKHNKEHFSLNTGSYVLYLGKSCPILCGEKTHIRDMSFFVTNGNIKNQIVALYMAAAHRIIPDRLKYWSRVMGLSPASVKINSARTRWGSCSSKGAINFSWFLIVADITSVDYVIIHELTHLRHMNHSKAFWSEVAAYDPKYLEHKEYLASLSKRLQSENW